jgi:uncharacterized membrane protein YsdA (DUF1294 family)
MSPSMSPRPIAVLVFILAGLLVTPRTASVWAHRQAPSGWVNLFGFTGLTILATLVPLCSAVAFVLYWLDKRAARQPGAARTRERTLHLASLGGGWPGAWAAQRAFSHKTAKASFQATFKACIAGHLLIVAACSAAAMWR